MSVSTNWEEVVGAEAIFWMFNSIVFAQSVIQTVLQCLILGYSIGEVDGKDENMFGSQHFLSEDFIVGSFEAILLTELPSN